MRAVSIGFRALEYAFMDDGGIRFGKTEVLELSLVTVPANADAVISTIKSIDAPVLAATGKEPKETDRPVPPGASGKSTKPVNLRPKEATKMKTLAEQISAFEAKRAANSARMDEIQSKAADEGRTKDASEKEEFGTLADEIDTIDEELKDLRRMEKAKALAAKPVNRIERTDDGVAARSGVTVKTQPKLAPGIAFARIARVKALSKLDVVSAQEIARRCYGEESSAYWLLRQGGRYPGDDRGRDLGWRPRR